MFQKNLAKILLIFHTITNFPPKTSLFISFFLHFSCYRSFMGQIMFVFTLFYSAAVKAMDYRHLFDASQKPGRRTEEVPPIHKTMVMTVRTARVMLFRLSIQAKPHFFSKKMKIPR